MNNNVSINAMHKPVMHGIKFQSQLFLWPQVHKTHNQHLQPASTNIYERMSCPQDLTEFHDSTVTGCHLHNKSTYVLTIK